MKRLFNGFILAFVLLLSAGCATPTPTPYQKMGVGGGYEETHIKDNIYYVQVVVNGLTTTAAVAVQYLERRAKELCEEKGYDGYQIRDQRQSEPGSSDRSLGYGPRTGGVGYLTNITISGNVECLKKKSK